MFGHVPESGGIQIRISGEAPGRQCDSSLRVVLGCFVNHYFGMSDLVTLLVQCIYSFVILQRFANTCSNGMPTLLHSGLQERVVSRAMA